MRDAEIILLCVRWYLRYMLSSRDLEERMAQRGLHVDHTTLYLSRPVRRARVGEALPPSSASGTTDSWRVDETEVSVKGVWMYLYRAVDAQGSTVEFQLSPTRDTQATKRFFAKALSASHTVVPRVITVDKNAASPKALKERQGTGDLAASGEFRQSNSLNNLVEQDHCAHQTAGQTRNGLLFF